MEHIAEQGSPVCNEAEFIAVFYLISSIANSSSHWIILQMTSEVVDIIQ